MGRNALSDEEKILSGTFRRDRVEPALLITDRLPIPPPSHLTQWAKEVWSVAITLLMENGNDIAVFQPTLETYCELCSEIEFCNRIIKKEGYMSAVIKNGVPTMEFNQWTARREKAQKTMLTYAVQLGFTPAARSRISGGQAKKETDEFGHFLKTGK